MGQIGRIPALIGKIRENHIDFVGIVETKKKSPTSIQVSYGPFQEAFLFPRVICQPRVQLEVS